MVGRRVGRADCHERTILEEFRLTFSCKNRFIVVILGALSSFGLFLVFSVESWTIYYSNDIDFELIGFFLSKTRINPNDLKTMIWRDNTTFDTPSCTKKINRIRVGLGPVLYFYQNRQSVDWWDKPPSNVPARAFIDIRVKLINRGKILQD